MELGLSRGAGWVRRRPRLIAGVGAFAIAATTLGVTMMPRSAHAAQSIDVYVGYADNEHGTTPPTFPSPWAGSPNTNFSGCSPVASCVFDGGVVRVVNNTASTHSINVVVHVSTCTFADWSAVSTAPGAEDIFTQTQSGGDNGCKVFGPGLMDTSDIGPNGSQWGDNCNQSGVIPTVDVTVDGVTTTFTDKGQVINTGGIDLGNCPVGSDENHAWSQIGNIPGPAPTMTGEAYGAAAHASLLGLVQLINVARTPDTHPVATQTDSDTLPTTPCVVTLTGVITGGVLCARVQTTAATGTSTATASVANATVNLGVLGLGIPVIGVTTIASQSTTTCAGSTGGATLVSLTIAGVPYTLPSPLPKNFTIPLVVGKLVLNEQVPFTGGLTVNALHLYVGPILGTSVDVVLASSQSDIENC